MRLIATESPPSHRLRYLVYSKYGAMAIWQKAKSQIIGPTCEQGVRGFRPTEYAENLLKLLFCDQRGAGGGRIRARTRIGACHIVRFDPEVIVFRGIVTASLVSLALAGCTAQSFAPSL